MHSRGMTPTLTTIEMYIFPQTTIYRIKMNNYLPKDSYNYTSNKRRHTFYLKNEHSFLFS